MNSTDPARLDDLLGYHLRRGQLRAFAAFAELVAQTGLTPMLYGVLATVAARPGDGQRDIAESLGADPSTMVRLIDQLEGRGLLRRVTHATDRRTSVPTLTEDGRALLARATPLVRASEERFAAVLSGAERTQLLHLLRRLNGVAAAEGGALSSG
jgi:DNA-binding MarR family transcriptional regulator